MKISEEYKGSRINMTQAAGVVSMEVGHFRRLVRRGVFPNPKRTAKGMPYLDYDLLCEVGQVLKSGIGVSGEEISFYRRKPKISQASRSRNQATRKDRYIESILEGCKQLGVDERILDAGKVRSILRDAFGKDRPELHEAIPVVVRKISGEGR